VIAVERDQRCLPALEEIAAAYPGKLDIISATHSLCRRSHPACGCARRRNLPTMWERAFDQMAHGGCLAALVDQPHFDVPARSGRAHHRKPAVRIMAGWRC